MRNWFVVQCPGTADDLFIEPFTENGYEHMIRIYLHPSKRLLLIEHHAVGKDIYYDKSLYRVLAPNIDFPEEYFIQHKKLFVWFFNEVIPNGRMVLLRTKGKHIPNYLQMLQLREVGL